MEDEEIRDPQNSPGNRTSQENEEKIPGQSQNPWENDVFDDTDPNIKKERKDPKRTLFY